MTGERVGILEVLKDTGKTKYKRPSKIWLCRCDCGKEKEYSTTELLCGVKSCGCLRQKNLDTFGDRNKGKTPANTLELGESTIRTIYCQYKHSAKKRNIPFHLESAEFRELIFQNCHYCDKPPSQTKTDKHRKEGNVLYNGIDRQNNRKGYKTSNCVPCCKICNRAKDTMSVNEFYEWASRINSLKTISSDIQ